MKNISSPKNVVFQIGDIFTKTVVFGEKDVEADLSALKYQLNDNVHLTDGLTKKYDKCDKTDEKFKSVPLCFRYGQLEYIISQVDDDNVEFKRNFIDVDGTRQKLPDLPFWCVNGKITFFLRNNISILWSCCVIPFINCYNGV